MTCHDELDRNTAYNSMDRGRLNLSLILVLDFLSYIAAVKL